MSIDLKVSRPLSSNYSKRFYDVKQHVRERFAMGPLKECKNPRKLLHNTFGTQETDKEHPIMLWVYPVLRSAAVHPTPGFEV